MYIARDNFIYWIQKRLLKDILHKNQKLKNKNRNLNPNLSLNKKQRIEIKLLLEKFLNKNIL